jgi:hypothetical protein
LASRQTTRFISDRMTGHHNGQTVPQSQFRVPGCLSGRATSYWTGRLRHFSFATFFIGRAEDDFSPPRETASITWQEGPLTIRTMICSREHMDLYERLRQSEQSRRLAWQFFKRSAKSWRFLATSGFPTKARGSASVRKGTFWCEPWSDVLSQCRFRVGRLECKLAELERLAAEQRLPREVLQAVCHLSRRQEGIGLSDQELRQRLDQLKELHILPEQRAKVGLEDFEDDESSV